MITLRRAKERHVDKRRKQEVARTFYRHHQPHALADGFGSLRLLNEYALSPGASMSRHLGRNAEIITYVREGSLAYEDSLGRSGIILAGEFQYMTDARGNRQGEMNASRTDSAHVFQLTLRATVAGLAPSYARKRFTVAERKGNLCVIASSDGRNESLLIHQDTVVYSALLGTGRHVVHELLPGRRAWLQIVKGAATLGDVILTTGDGAGVVDERALSITASEETEILVVDLDASVSKIPQLDIVS